MSDKILADSMERSDTMDGSVTSGLREVNDKLVVQGGLIQEFTGKLENCTGQIESFTKETRMNTDAVRKLTRKVGHHDLCGLHIFTSIRNCMFLLSKHCV